MMDANGSSPIQLTPISSVGNNEDPDWGKTPVEITQDLSTKVNGLGLPPDIEKRLVDKLAAAKLQITAQKCTPARQTLLAFINQVNGQIGKTLTSAQADELTAIARGIINSIPGK